MFNTLVLDRLKFSRSLPRQYHTGYITVANQDSQRHSTHVVTVCCPAALFRQPNIYQFHGIASLKKKKNPMEQGCERLLRGSVPETLNQRCQTYGPQARTGPSGALIQPRSKWSLSLVPDDQGCVLCPCVLCPCILSQF